MSKVLVVFDMQNVFINGNNEAQNIIQNVNEKINQYRENNDRVILFMRNADRIYDTDGWRLADGINDNECIHVNRDRSGWTDWSAFIDEYDIDEIELAGLYSDTTVITNTLILKTIFPERKITVDSSCCAGTTPDNHSAALQVMRSCQINVI